MTMMTDNQAELTNLCIKLEVFETDPWAANRILDHEILTPIVVEPCVGPGILANAAKARGYIVQCHDIYDWKYPDTIVGDFLAIERKDWPLPEDSWTAFLNPPFSLAEEFIKKCIDLGARKIVCFQRFAWWESDNREDFWNEYRPNRIYICADRATCWRYDLPRNDKGHRFDIETGKKLSTSPTAHAFYVWEKNQPPGTIVGHIRKL